MNRRLTTLGPCSSGNHSSGKLSQRDARREASTIQSSQNQDQDKNQYQNQNRRLKTYRYTTGEKKNNTSPSECAPPPPSPPVDLLTCGVEEEEEGELSKMSRIKSKPRGEGRSQGRVKVGGEGEAEEEEAADGRHRALRDLGGQHAPPHHGDRGAHRVPQARSHGHPHRVLVGRQLPITSAQRNNGS